MSDLLVSVRSAPEARAALTGGAGLIDVKEPSRGSLGRADDATIAAVVREVAGRRPVSAALGELAESASLPAPMGLAFVKWGLAGCGRIDWRHLLSERLQPGCQRVVVAYADWQRAAAVPPEEVCDFAAEHGCGAVLFDTWRKDGTTLTDWLSPYALGRHLDRCQTAGVRVALAGALGPGQIRTLLPLCPDWFAVRGAACRDGERTNGIDADAVRRLVDLIAPAATFAN